MPPHIHAKYQGKYACFDFSGKKIEGGIPKSKERLVKAGIEIHCDELIANYELLQTEGKVCKIEPLR